MTEPPTVNRPRASGVPGASPSVEQPLRLAEQRLAAHVENTPLAVIEWGPDFRLSRWSKEAERVFGWRADEVLGRRQDEFRWIHEEDMAKVAQVAAGLREGVVVTVFPDAGFKYLSDRFWEE